MAARLAVSAPSASFVWRYRGQWYTSTPEADACPMCGANAVVLLPDALLDEQTDGTQFVCHPSVGGCNQGFTMPGDS